MGLDALTTYKYEIFRSGSDPLMGSYEKCKWMMYYLRTPKGRHDAQGVLRFSSFYFAAGVFCLEMGISLWVSE